MGFDQKYYTFVERIFNNWQNLRLAVEHGMGGRNGQKVANELMEYVCNYCLRNENITQGELVEVMEDILDQEFNTICDDNSIPEIALNLIRYKEMSKAGNFEQIEAELSKLPNCEKWLGENCSVRIAELDEKESNSSSSDESDEMDVDEPVSGTEEAEEVGGLNKAGKGTSLNSEEDGWTIVKNKRK